MRKLFCIILITVSFIFLRGCDNKQIIYTFDANGGKFSNNSTVKYEYYPDHNAYPGISCARPTDFSYFCLENYPARDGYFFIDWKSNMDGTGVSYSNFDISSSNSDKTFYAYWLPNSEGYIINFNTDAPRLSVASVTGISPNTATVLPTNSDIERVGFILLGWHIDKNANTPILHTENFKFNYFPFKNINLIAVWYNWLGPFIGNCTVNFDPNGGVLDDPVASSVQTLCGDEISFPSASKDGVPVSGWYSYSHPYVYAYPGKYFAVKDNITFSAVWE